MKKPNNVRPRARRPRRTASVEPCSNRLCDGYDPKTKVYCDKCYAAAERDDAHGMGGWA